MSQFPDIRVKHETDYSIIIIDPVEVNSQGNYTCIVSNEFGKDSYTAELLVEGKSFSLLIYFIILPFFYLLTCK